VEGGHEAVRDDAVHLHDTASPGHTEKNEDDVLASLLEQRPLVVPAGKGDEAIVEPEHVRYPLEGAAILVGEVQPEELALAQEALDLGPGCRQYRSGPRHENVSRQRPRLSDTVHHRAALSSFGTALAHRIPPRLVDRV
jgi:hypothetical protein